MIKLKAYHGTLKKNVNSIKENGFIISTKNFEWLGTGIYFFADKEFAEQWALQESLKRKGPNREPAVLSADLICNEEEFFDLDIEENMKRLVGTITTAVSIKDNRGRFVIQDKEANRILRCMACNLFSKAENIKIYAYSFPALQFNVIGFPIPKPQRQYAVQDNSYILNVNEVPMEVDDDATV